MMHALIRSLSPGGRYGRHQTLLFHRVLAEPDVMIPGDPDALSFDALIAALKQHFNILPLDEAMQRLATASLPPASLSITFDDGYADNATVALPILQKHGVSATFFIATAYLDGGRMWNDTVIETLRQVPEGELDLSALGLGRHLVRDGNRADISQHLLTGIKHRSAEERQQLADRIGEHVPGLPTDLMMSGPQVRQLAAAGMGLGGHTHTHPILSCLPDDTARDDMAQGRDVLSSLLGERVELFAYPNGRYGQDFDERHARMARELGFKAAMTTETGVSRRDSDPWQLPRFTPWDQTHGRFMLRLLMNRYGLLG